MDCANINSIEVNDVSLDAAFQTAVQNITPVFFPARTFVDDRGWSLVNQLQGVLATEGQINYSVTYPGVIKAWHRHQRQTDFWLCVMGHLKVGVHREDGKLWQMVVGETRPGIIVIPRTLWHGASTVGHVPAGLLYYVTHQYVPQNPDEERRAFDSVEGFSWGMQPR